MQLSKEKDQQDSDIQIAIARCETCAQLVPVWVHDVRLDKDEMLDPSGDQLVKVVLCIICLNILNNEDINVEYYRPEDIEKVTNFKVGDCL